MNRFIRFTFVYCSLALPASASAIDTEVDDYGSARAQMIAAYQVEDFSTMRAAAGMALEFRPDHPGARFNLALAHALNDDPASALAELHRVADMKVYFPIETTAAFSELHERFTWPDLLFKLERLQRPTGTATVTANFGPKDFIPEGILRLGKEHFLLGSIRHGKVLEWRDGEVHELSAPERGGHWSVFGMRRDAQGKVWFASAAVRQFNGLAENEFGRSGLFRLDLDSGEIIDEMLLPDDGRQHVLGDLVIAGDGMIYTTDSLTGAVYRYDPMLRALHVLVEPGALVSPQGLVLLPGEDFLLVADYAQGLFRVGTTDGETSKVDNTTLQSVHGIDGLYREGDTLVAIQNGIRPHRVARFSYDMTNNRITDAGIVVANQPEFREPTLGQLDDGDFWFVANSQWDRLDADGGLDESDLATPLILRTTIE